MIVVPSYSEIPSRAAMRPTLIAHPFAVADLELLSEITLHGL